MTDEALDYLSENVAQEGWPEALLDTVQASAIARNEVPVSRTFFELALHRIYSRQEKVATYPTGMPTGISVYNIAFRLQQERTELS